MQLDGVIVRTIEGKSERWHRECVGVDAIENDSPVLRRLSRSDFATERAYTEAERSSPNLHLLWRDHSHRGVRDGA